MQENNNLHSFDDVMDNLYGKEGTPQREAFRSEARTYCVGQMIYNARKEEHLTQSELATRIGSTKSYISRIEKGMVEPGASLFFRIIDALGLRVEIVKPLV